jgi:hypothetical protein
MWVGSQGMRYYGRCVASHPGSPFLQSQLQNSSSKASKVMNKHFVYASSVLSCVRLPSPVLHLGYPVLDCIAVGLGDVGESRRGNTGSSRPWTRTWSDEGRHSAFTAFRSKTTSWLTHRASRTPQSRVLARSGPRESRLCLGERSVLPGHRSLSVETRRMSAVGRRRGAILFWRLCILRRYFDAETLLSNRRFGFGCRRRGFIRRVHRSVVQVNTVDSPLFRNHLTRSRLILELHPLRCRRWLRTKRRSLHRPLLLQQLLWVVSRLSNA